MNLAFYHLVQVQDFFWHPQIFFIMEEQYVDNTIDFKSLLSDIRKRWYYFAISIFILLIIAFIYTQFAEKRYQANASLLISKQELGSSQASEMLAPLEQKYIERNIGMRDEISKITSSDALRESLRKLDFGTSYYTVEPFWPEFMHKLWLNEKYAQVPISVRIDSSAVQPIGVLFKVDVLKGGGLHITAEGDEVTIYDFEDFRAVEELPSFDFEVSLRPGEAYKSDFVSFTIDAKKSLRYYEGQSLYFKFNSLNSLVDSFKENLLVEQAGKELEQSRVMRLSVEDEVPRKANLFLATLIDTYQERDLDSKNMKGSNTVRFLNEELAVIADSLKSAKLNLQTFKANNQIVDLSSTKESSLGAMGELQQQQAFLNDKLGYFQQTLRYLKDPKNANKLIAPSAMGIEDNTFESLISEYIDINARARRMLNYDNPDENPLIERLNLQLSSLRGAIVENLNNAMESTRVQLRNVNRRLGSIQGRVDALPENEQTLIELERDFNYYSEKYNYLIDKKSEAELSLATNTADIEVVDSVELLDEPVFPNAKLIFLAALFLGMIIPLGFILPGHFMNSKIADREDLENQTEIPLLGIIANGPKNAKMVFRDCENSAVVESFEFARINLQHFFKEPPNKIIGITSSIEGEGKTFCSINLAHAFAEAGDRTLLVGADLRRPKFQGYFAQKVHYGLSDYLNQDFNFEKVIVPTFHDRLDVIFSGTIQNNPIKLLEKERAEKLFSLLRSKYDRIIVDTPPVGLVADYFLLLKYFDINLFIVRNNYTNKDILKGINDLQKNRKIKNLNLLFNDVESFSGYGYMKNAHNYYTEKTKRSFKL